MRKKALSPRSLGVFTEEQLKDAAVKKKVFKTIFKPGTVGGALGTLLDPEVRVKMAMMAAIVSPNAQRMRKKLEKELKRPIDDQELMQRTNPELYSRGGQLLKLAVALDILVKDKVINEDTKTMLVDIWTENVGITGIIHRTFEEGEGRKKRGTKTRSSSR